MDVGEKVWLLLKSRNKSTMDVATAVGIAKPTLYRKLKDEVAFSIDEAVAIGVILNLSADDFFHVFCTKKVLKTQLL